ncbi:hypothetical protein M427DRAFT_399501 [Gonapodya prolifera JEL478]|uniref:Uncharacterized protein n=1 Tax=Gonapodya prolifera (strain JEL478) TaxID=1344416 RepID=A0A139AU10_GONPJ|nr:hypothetical protein M427DRAFT_399501 [Gonapodya prolifera JEL478]|eukprot:KXS19985.1 hypothetical protein M427DRAFT_399501 [Gonapodya prolifera JEL478]
MVTRQRADTGLSIVAFLCIKVSPTIQALLVLYSHEFSVSNDENISGSLLEVSPTTVSGGKSLEASPTMATVGGWSLTSNKYS